MIFLCVFVSKPFIDMHALWCYIEFIEDKGEKK